ncbi:MAG TPA: hypothetical protein VGQ51_17765, partial [Puia sp.]|nr:hypothetical protein [Puia sp.]
EAAKDEASRGGIAGEAAKDEASRGGIAGEAALADALVARAGAGSQLRYLLKKSIVRCQASSAAALS